MNDYTVSEIKPSDKRGRLQMTKLLINAGIETDGNLDLSLGLFDEDYNLVATGSCFKNTLRCMAVDPKHQGEGLLNRVVTELISRQYERGNRDLFLYTKYDSAKMFADLGFYEIIRVDGKVVFMENRRGGFSSYLDELAKTRTAGNSAAIVMNANPFTKGHRYLVETAAAACDTLHLFVVSEDSSLVPFDVRYRLVKEGTADLGNVILHKTGSYIISNATFPSYFLKDSELVIKSHARLDAEIFIKIARALGVTRRFVGEEPFSKVTFLYNKVLKEILPAGGVDLTEIKRKTCEGEPISASAVRKALQTGDKDILRKMLPDSSYAYFTSEEARPVIEKIKAASEVLHY